jgi:sugar lactone lactonase YvrE
MNVRQWIAVALTVLGVSTFGAPPAGAAIKQALIFSFGSLAGPNDIAVDQSNGHVFVSENNGGDGAVKEYKPAGPTEYVLGEQLPKEETPSKSFNFGGILPGGVAVDKSSHAVYVADILNGVVDEFKLNGSNEYKYVCQFTGWYGAGQEACSPTAGTIEQTFSNPAGVAVDDNGNLYVSDFGHATIDVFNANGVGVKQIPNAQWSDIASPSGLAVDTGNDIYVESFQGPVAALKLDGLGEVESQSILDESKSFAVGVDQGLHDVYVAHRNEGIVSAYNSLGAPLDTLSVPGLESIGVAANETTHDVFVSDTVAGDVHVFGPPIVVPDVRLAGEATAVTSSGATLQGEIDPDATSEASYYFEYGTASPSGATSPAPPGTSVEGNAYVPATTGLTGLEPNTIYHYRLVGTNNSGLTNASVEEGAFRTATAPPEITAAEATEVTDDSVVFRGQVNPKNEATHYHFEYGETAGYGQTLPDIGIGTGGSPVAVEQAAAPVNLRPGTVYHYRIVAENGVREVSASADQTFQTPTTAPPPTAPPAVSINPPGAIAQTGATLSGVVNPEGVPTTYAFELGSAAGAYETRVFGNLAGEGESRTVTATFTSLQPGAVYHYRLLATSAAGTTASPDQTFATAVFTQSIAIPAAPELVPTPVFPAVRYGPLKCRKGYVKKGGGCVRKRRPHKRPRQHRRPRPKTRRR